MADELIDKILEPELIVKASPNIINPEPSKSKASEEDWASTIERHTIAELEESQDEKKEV